MTWLQQFWGVMGIICLLITCFRLYIVFKVRPLFVRVHQFGHATVQGSLAWMLLVGSFGGEAALVVHGVYGVVAGVLLVHVGTPLARRMTNAEPSASETAAD